MEIQIFDCLAKNIEIRDSYVYMVRNKNTEHWYIGRQCDSNKIIGINYFTSSKAKREIAKWFQESFCENSLTLNSWEIIILYQGEQYKDYEERWIDLFGLHHPIDNPLSLNFNKGKKDFASISGNGNPKNNPVGMFRNEQLIAKFCGTREASRITNINQSCISRSANGYVFSAGFIHVTNNSLVISDRAQVGSPKNYQPLIWRYLDENGNPIEPKSNKWKQDNPLKKRVAAYYEDGNYIDTFSSPSDVEKIHNISATAIIACARGKRKTTGVFNPQTKSFVHLGRGSHKLPENCVYVYWRYLDEFNEIILPVYDTWKINFTKGISISAYYGDDILIKSYSS